MRVVVTGATGLIGKALCRRLGKDYEIVALSRNAEKAQAILGPNIKVVQWEGPWAQYVEGAFAVINLAGENVASGRWTKTKMERILQSRVNAAKAIAGAITSVKNKPAVLIQASASGYYGSGQEPADENAGKGEGFLADVCEKWEAAVPAAAKQNIRTVFIRTGLVLSSTGGALPKLTAPFKFFLGGYPGTGNQWVSWITIDDEVAAIRFLLENQRLSGAFNLTTPNPVTMKELARAIGRTLNRPCWLPIPALVLRLAAGKMADEMLLTGRLVIPDRLLKAGFTFAHPGINEALEFILGKGKK